MVYFYCTGKCRIPQEKLKKLINLSKSNLSIDSLPFVTGSYSLQNATIPTMSKDMAEFLGILYGDGCLGNYGYLIDISGDSKADLLYHIKRVKPLLHSLFGLEPRFKFEKDKQEMHTKLTSKMVHEHLSAAYFFPIGYKKGRMSVPAIIYENGEYKNSFLRGLFDTDGGVHRHHKTSIQVQFTSYDSLFLKQVCELFRGLRFNARINGTDIQIRGKSEIDRFFQLICPANPKHQYKYEQFKRTGIVPLHREIDYSVIGKGEIGCESRDLNPGPNLGKVRS